MKTQGYFRPEDIENKKKIESKLIDIWLYICKLITELK